MKEREKEEKRRGEKKKVTSRKGRKEIESERLARFEFRAYIRMSQRVLTPSCFLNIAPKSRFRIVYEYAAHRRFLRPERRITTARFPGRQKRGERKISLVSSRKPGYRK